MQLYSVVEYLVSWVTCKVILHVYVGKLLMMRPLRLLILIILNALSGWLL